MELKEGFKKTGVGILPKDWKVVTLGEISKPVRGGSPRPAGDPRFFDGNFIPWLTVAAITNASNSQLYITETKSCLTEEGSKYSRQLDENTLVIANSGFSLGVAKILMVKSCANDGIAALQGFDSKINKVFVTYYLNSITEKLRKVIAIGNDQPNLNTDRICNIKIPLPPTTDEQNKIATALYDTDALITSIQKLIAKKRMIKQGAMQKLLSPKEDWVKERLGDIFDVTRGLVLSTIKVEDTKIGSFIYPVFSSQTKDNGLLGYYDRYLYENAITWTTDGANAGDVKFRQGRFYCTNVCGVLLSKKRIANYCIAAIFNSISRHYVSYVGNPKLMNNVVSNIEVVIPPTIEEQNQISTILSDMDSEIESLETKLAKYEQIKQGMMQQLLTGKIRLVKPGSKKQVIHLPLAAEPKEDYTET